MASYAYPQIIKAGGGGTSTTPGGGGDIASTAYGNMKALYPNLDDTKSQASANILNELKGQLSPETVNSIQDEAARFGVSSGMPLSGLAGNRGLKNLGLSVEQLQGQGLQDYLNSLKTYSGTLAPTTGELTQKYGIDTSAATAAAGQGLDAARLAEQQREFDISHYLQNALQTGGLNQSYLNTYMNLLG